MSDVGELVRHLTELSDADLTAVVRAATDGRPGLDALRRATTMTTVVVPEIVMTASRGPDPMEEIRLSLRKSLRRES